MGCICGWRSNDSNISFIYVDKQLDNLLSRKNQEKKVKSRLAEELRCTIQDKTDTFSPNVTIWNELQWALLCHVHWNTSEIVWFYLVVGVHGNLRQTIRRKQATKNQRLTFLFMTAELLYIVLIVSCRRLRVQCYLVVCFPPVVIHIHTQIPSSALTGATGSVLSESHPFSSLGCTLCNESMFSWTLWEMFFMSLF